MHQEKSILVVSFVGGIKLFYSSLMSVRRVTSIQKKNWHIKNLNLMADPYNNKTTYDSCMKQEIENRNGEREIWICKI